MLRISKLADYGTVVMVALARRSPALCNARDVTRHTHLNMPTVSKLLKRLTVAGFLTSVRGAQGGYCLKYPASNISLAQIIYALEDQRGLIECGAEPNPCSLQGICGIQSNWQIISQTIEAALDSISLEQLAKPALSAHELDKVKKIMGVVNGVST